MGAACKHKRFTAARVELLNRHGAQLGASPKYGRKACCSAAYGSPKPCCRIELDRLLQLATHAT